MSISLTMSTKLLFIYALAILSAISSLPSAVTARSNVNHSITNIALNHQQKNCSAPASKKHISFTPERKAFKGVWLAEQENPSHRIILSAGHVNRVSGTTGYNNASLVDLHGQRHTTEAALTKIVTPFMVRVGRERGFIVEQFIAESTTFKEATLELAYYEKAVNGIAFEIHSDAPSEGHHRAPGYDGQTGIIPPVDGTITTAEACAGLYLGKFKKGLRNLYAPKQGISLFELFPTNQAITDALHRAVNTGNYAPVEHLVLPYVHLFFDALEQGGIKPSSSISDIPY